VTLYNGPSSPQRLVKHTSTYVNGLRHRLYLLFLNHLRDVRSTVVLRKKESLAWGLNWCFWIPLSFSLLKLSSHFHSFHIIFKIKFCIYFKHLFFLNFLCFVLSVYTFSPLFFLQLSPIYLPMYFHSLYAIISFLHFLSNKEWEGVCYNWCDRNSVDSEREMSKKVP